jgi:hypothetical protein
MYVTSDTSGLVEQGKKKPRTFDVLKTREFNIVPHCILASCYIRFTLNICSFVHQCNIHFLLFIIRRHVSASHGHLQVL